MRVSETGEFGLIDILRRMLGREQGDLVLGAGDDTAVFRGRGGELCAYTVDALVEGAHFDPAYVPWHSLGYKSLAINLSDLAAMGGCEESFALVVLGLRDDLEVEALEEMYRGMLDCGEEYSCRLAGGDIVRSPGRMFVSVSLLGSLSDERFLTRSGARPGQSIMVTGWLGDSYLGLKWLMSGRGEDNHCARRHLYPAPRLEKGKRALAMGATAAIDISDGLLRDLGHICEESGTGAQIELRKLPISPDAVRAAEELGEDRVGAALHGGEDYELILVADGKEASEMQREMGVVAIGEITAGSGVRVLDESGRVVNMGRIGYEHFKEG